MTRPLIQIDEVVREMTEEEYLEWSSIQLSEQIPLEETK